MNSVQPKNKALQEAGPIGSARLVTRLATSAATTALVAATFCAVPQAFAQTAPAAVAPHHIVPHAAARAPRHVSTRRETHPPRAPESSQGQVTNANATAPNAGVFPFIPPYFAKLPGAGLSVDTKGIGYATDDKDVQFRIGGRYQEDFSAAKTSPRLRSTATSPWWLPTASTPAVPFSKPI